MADLWYAILAFTVIGYVVLDGRNLGAGALMPWIARDERERSAVIKAIGPLWTWHEVWLLATGGVLFVAFPRVLATALSGFYLAVFLLLWCFIGRGISLEVSSHLDDRLWRRFFHTVFALSSAALAVLLGATVGNLVRGVPLQPGEPFMLPLFVDFGASLPNGILDWYTLSTAEVSLQAGKPRVHSVVAVADMGRVINPRHAATQIESGIVFGLSAVLHQRISFEQGRVQQSNFHDFPILRQAEMPRVQVHLLPSEDAPGGAGEPGTPPIAPAVANAVLALTGKPLTLLPYSAG